jgi:hypothetical protein
MSKETIWSIIISSFVTIAVSFLFWGKEERKPVMAVIHTNQIDTNVYIASITFWNNGKLPINKEDVRRNFYIFLNDNTSKLLGYLITEENEPDIANFKIEKIGDKLRIDWDHFDPNYGFKMQITYTGNNRTKILTSGSVLGAKVKIVNFIPPQSGLFSIMGAVLLTILLSISVFYSFFDMFLTIKEKGYKVLKDKRFLRPSLGFLFLNLFFIFVIYWYIQVIVGIKIPF